MLCVTMKGTIFAPNVRRVWSQLHGIHYRGSEMMPPENPYTTSVLLIDGNPTERAFYAEGLKRCSPDYLILEASDGQSGLALYRQASRIECVVLEASLPDRSGFALLVDLVPIPSRPNVAVIVLSRLGHRGLWNLAKLTGAYAYLIKQHTSGEDLHKEIQRAVAFVELLPKEDRHRPLY
jgi:CheY-like chemotaxis protein